VASDELDIRRLTDTCVHCGFCLPACPTYQLWGAEADSPRGRIHLIRQVADGVAGPLDVVDHLDACLGCLACVPACPSGVKYDEIIEAGRELVEPTRTGVDRLTREAIFGLFPYKRRLNLVRGLTPPSWAGPAAKAAAAIAPPRRRRITLPRKVSARGTARRAVVGLLTGCVQSAFFSHVSAATARVLAREGCDVIIPRSQGCCGALALHTGRREQAKRLARRTVAAFTRAGVDVIVTDVAGCGSTMKEYDRLLADDPRWSAPAARFAAGTRDVTELLADLDPIAERYPVPLTVAYHDACHLAHGQGITAAPRSLLSGIPDLRLVEVPEGATCCGSAGVYNLLQPDTAAELGDRKARAVASTRADLVAAGNPGCLLQISAALKRLGSPLPAHHTIEILDAALNPPG
jgi:glycolate oxidase iron-sulfur subunit